MSSLADERAYRVKAKRRILSKIHNKITIKAFNQALNVINKHNIELVKIDKILKDGFVW
jgi:hypothetical protein